METNDPPLMHLQTAALSVECPGCDTPERLLVAAEMVSAQGAFPTTELPIIREPEESAIDRALRGKCFIPTF